LLKLRQFDPTKRESGDDWPGFGYTMVGLKRLANVQYAVETVLSEGIPGDLCECGAWRGGCSMFMRAVLKQDGCSNRVIWVADSFEGMPKPDANLYAADCGYDLSQNDYLSVPLEMVKENFRRFDLLDEQVRFLKGWFRDTLPNAPIKELAVLRADGDLYESTMTTLTCLYDKVSPGGFIIIDDYGTWEPCKKAVESFRASRNITEPIQTIDRCGVFWRKNKI
jgi:hypothetical protein